MFVLKILIKFLFVAAAFRSIALNILRFPNVAIFICDSHTNIKRNINTLKQTVFVGELTAILFANPKRKEIFAEQAVVKCVCIDCVYRT